MRFLKNEWSAGMVGGVCVEMSVCRLPMLWLFKGLDVVDWLGV